MTIATTQNSTTVQGNGATNTFQFSFVGDSVSDIVVQYTDASGIATTLLPSQYTVFLNPPSIGQIWGQGGTVTYPLSGSPIAATTYLTISRQLPLQQLISISNQGDFSPQVIEEMGDTLEMQIQQVAARTGQIRGVWLTNTEYNFGDIVQDGINGNSTFNLYMCANGNLSGVWSVDLAAGDWSLALNVQAIVNALPIIPNNTVFGNISGGSETPIGVSVSALFDSVFGNTQGSILYRGLTAWNILTPGVAGYVLTTQGASANPSWVASTSGGTITSVIAGNGISGGGSSGAVSVALSNIANGSILANLSGIGAAAIGTTLTAIIDSVINNTQGAILYRNGTVWTALVPGTSGQFLQSGGTAANPSWGNVSIPTATSSTLGIVKPDNSTITISGGTLSANIPLMTALGVGSIILAIYGGIVNPLSAGTTTAASNLTSVGFISNGSMANTINATPSDTLAGTWRALQSAIPNTNNTSTVLFQRVV